MLIFSRMNELLAPVGNKEAFYAAIANGANAVYLGLNKHNARAYADNFSLDNLKEYVDFAHLRNVKVYVTLNTIAYDTELEEIYSMVDALASLNVDAIIVQDLAVLNYAANTYKSLEVHASTQMGIDDVYGAKFLKELGVTRVVLARETPLEIIKEIKQKADIEVESFIHGALCVSYSGNCFMSAAIGERSGNRGRCAGCCRKLYTLIDTKSNKRIKSGYLLSMKDLNVSKNIKKDMSFIDSFKIEGRMKEESYVAAVTNIYRHILDNEKVDYSDLDKVFNRTYTKGFINNEDSKDITNVSRPNNFGYPIGKIIKTYENKIWIKLDNQILSQGDTIRIENDTSFEDDVNIVITKMFDNNYKLINSSDKLVMLYTEKKVKENSLVYKIKDINFNKTLNLGNKIKEYKKLGISLSISIKFDEQILLKVTYKDHTVYQKSEYIVCKSQSKPTTKEDIFAHISKLNDTPYYIENLDIVLDDEVFVPVKVINDLRRDVIAKLNSSRLNLKVIKNKKQNQIIPKENIEINPTLMIQVSTPEQYEFVKNLGYENIYFKNIIRRNNVRYLNKEKSILFGGLSAIEYYKNNKEIELISDYSLNVNNHVSVGFLSSKGVDRITLSQEINEEQIKNLIETYKNTYNTHPNLELIIYGRMSLMHTKYCPLKRLGMCGKCRESNFAIKDEYESFPLKFNDDCTVNVLNGKTLNLIDDIHNIKGINYYRVIFTTETVKQIEEILNTVTKKMNGEKVNKCFDGRNHTRGNFRKELL